MCDAVMLHGARNSAAVHQSLGTEKMLIFVENEHNCVMFVAVLRGPPMKNVAPSAPHFGPAFLDFHVNRPVLSSGSAYRA